MFGLDTGLLILLFVCIFCTCVFEFINGFHDTANAVATVIYTNSLRPEVAVVLSGTLNFIGVFAGGIGVAMGIVSLLPMEAILQSDVSLNMCMVLAILITAIIWNFGTWYYGIPCSSSHTLIGSILGVVVAYAIYSTGDINRVNWGKAGEMGVSLLISPLIGFTLTMILMFILRLMVKNQKIFETPPDRKAPPGWLRAILILTCSGVSFSHGSNDGQKGVGLMMLILISILPAYFALDHNNKSINLSKNIVQIESYLPNIEKGNLPVNERENINSIKNHISDLKLLLKDSKSLDKFTTEQKTQIRRDILLISKDLNKLLKNESLNLSKSENKALKSKIKETEKLVAFAPTWVIVMISLSLGLGTMIGWKRIVVTIGEKIGKEHLTYAQGASSELVAASTIGFSTFMALPVSTTHVLSSGIAGSMVANKGLSNLQGGTIRNILIAWLLTLPVCIFLSLGLFFAFRMII